MSDVLVDVADDQASDDGITLEDNDLGPPPLDALSLSETELDRLKILVARRRAKTRATVFKDFCGHIVAKAPLETVALVLLRVNKRFRDASFDRISLLMPRLNKLFDKPFELERESEILLASAQTAVKGALSLDLYGKKIGDADMTHFSMACAAGALPHLKELNLFKNTICDSGIRTFAATCSTKDGVMLELETLELEKNFIADTGFRALAHSQIHGAFPQLKTLSLQNNKIGDSGMNALSAACTKKAVLTQLKRLYLGGNSIGNVGLQSFATACARQNGSLAKLATLNLAENKMGDVGLNAFSESIAKGALASLQTLYILEGHDFGDPAKEHFKATCDAREIVYRRDAIIIRKDQETVELSPEEKARAEKAARDRKAQLEFMGMAAMC